MEEQETGMNEPIHERVMALKNRLDSLAAQGKQETRLASLDLAHESIQKKTQKLNEAFSRTRTLIDDGIPQNENSIETDELSTQSKRLRTCLEGPEPERTMKEKDSEGNPGPLKLFVDELKEVTKNYDSEHYVTYDPQN